jgi:type II secretion system protein N
VKEPKAASEGPRRHQILGIAAAAVLLTGTFAYLRFPYERLATSLSSRLSEMGLGVEIGSMSPALSLAGPGLAAQDVRIVRGDGSVWRIDSVRVRPAWSLAWLMLRPALHLELATPQGELEGVAVLRGPQRFTGELREVDLTQLVGSEQLAGASLEGRASFDVDVALEDDGPSGPVKIHARDGVLTHPQLPMAIPYEELTGDLTFGGESLVEIASFELKSPMGTGSLKGKVGRDPDPSQAPLDLELAVQVAQGVRASLTSQGVRVGRDGQLQYKISGTAASPVVR